MNGMKKCAALLVGLLVSGSCALAQGGGESGGEDGRGTMRVSRVVVTPGGPMGLGWDGDVLRDVWRSRAFQRQFAESYLSETEIEPRVTSDEVAAINEVIGMVTEERVDEAIARLRDILENGVQVERRRRARDEEAAGTGVVSAVFDFTLGNLHFQRDELSPAVDAYKVAIQKHPKFRRAWKNLALVYVKQADFDEAARSLTEVVKLGGTDAVTYGLLGYSYSSLEKNLAAESAYRMAILLDPVTMDWKMGLAQSMFKQRQYAGAAAFVGELIGGDSGNANLWLLQANAYIGMNEPARAAENYEIADRLGGSTAASLNTLGDIYINQELFEPAVTAYLRALEMDAESGADRAIRAAKVLAARGETEMTKMLIGRIVGMRGDRLDDEQNKDLLKLRARIAVAEGSGDEEAKILEEIVKLDPLDGDALILLGQHSAESGEVDRAVFYFERAANLARYEADAKLRHGQLLVREKDYVGAIPLLRRSLQLKPRDTVQDYLDRVERLARRSQQ